MSAEVGVCLCICDYKQKAKVNIVEQLLVVQDLMARWRCTKRTIENKTRRHCKPRLKFVRLAHKQFFRPEDVVAFENLHLMNPMGNERAS